MAFLNKFTLKPFKEKFSDFNKFSVACGMPVGAIFISDRKTCRRCEGSLQVHGKPHVVVVYHSEFGTYLGSRMP